MSSKDWDYSKDELVNGLRKIRLKRGDIVFTHVGFGFLGKAKNCHTNEEASKMILDSFHDVLGAEGTVLVPTYTYSFCNKEVFDVQKTPSTIGPFTEHFRKLDGVIRSSDPIFSVAGLGPKAGELLINLPHTCFGRDSLYQRLVNVKGKICMIGLGLQWATFRHYIEEMVGVPFRYVKQFIGTIKDNESVRTETWDYFVRILSDNCYPNGKRLEELALTQGICHVARVGRGQVSSIDCQEFYNLGEAELQRNPWFTAKGPPLDARELEKLRLEERFVKKDLAID